MGEQALDDRSMTIEFVGHLCEMPASHRDAL